MSARATLTEQCEDRQCQRRVSQAEELSCRAKDRPGLTANDSLNALVEASASRAAPTKDARHSQESFPPGASRSVGFFRVRTTLYHSGEL
jgi:hypothetical protein